MWTLIWTENGGDRWDRFNREEAIEKLIELSENPDVTLGDVWVFPPKADDYAKTGEEILDELDNDEEDE